MPTSPSTRTDTSPLLTQQKSNAIDNTRLATKLAKDFLPLFGRSVAVMGRVFGATFAFTYADPEYLSVLPLIGDLDSTSMLFAGRSLMSVQTLVGTYFGENKKIRKQGSQLIAHLKASEELETLTQEITDTTLENKSEALQKLLKSIGYAYQIPPSDSSYATVPITPSSDANDNIDEPRNNEDYRIRLCKIESGQDVDTITLQKDDLIRAINKAKEHITEALTHTLQDLSHEIESLDNKIKLTNPTAYEQYLNLSLSLKQDKFNEIMDAIIQLRPDLGNALTLGQIARNGALSQPPLETIETKYQEIITENSAEIGRIGRHSLYLALLVSTPLSFMYYFANAKILNALGYDSEIVNRSDEYFKLAAFAFILVNTMTAIQRVFQGFKHLNSVFLSNAFQTFVSLIGYGLLILGPFGIPKYGMKGYGWSYIGGTLAAVIGYCAFLTKDKFKEYNFYSFSDGIHWPLLKQLATTGLPKGAEFAIDGFVNLAFTAIISHRGTMQAKALNLAAIFTLLMSVTSAALGAAVNGYGSNLMGKKRYLPAIRVGTIGLCYSLLLPTLAATGVFASGTKVPQIFFSAPSNNTLPLNHSLNTTAITSASANDHYAQLLTLTKYIGLIECAKQLFSGLQFVSSMSAISLGDKIKNFTVTMSATFVLALSLTLLFSVALTTDIEEIPLFALKLVGPALAALFNAGHWIDISNELLQSNGKITQKSIPNAIKDSASALMPSCLFGRPNTATGNEQNQAINSPTATGDHPYENAAPKS